MRAVLCREWGGPDKLLVEDAPSPAMRPGAVRLAVAAAGINFGDLLLVAGHYQDKPAFPFTPGMEVAGTITEIGPGVGNLKVGDRVMALTGIGGYAEEIVIDATRVVPIPAKMDLVTAAGFPVAYGTSHGAFQWRAHLKPGGGGLGFWGGGGGGGAAGGGGGGRGGEGICRPGGAGEGGGGAPTGPPGPSDKSRGE